MGKHDLSGPSFKLLYVTSQYPFGHSESFLGDEVRELLCQGASVDVLPVRRPGPIRDDGLGLSVVEAQLFEAKVVGATVRFALRHPFAFLHILRVLASDRRHLIKNLAVLPLGIYMGTTAKDAGYTHVHAHWLSTTATVAWLIRRVSGLPFSMTAHRWDIVDGNLVLPKAESAAFVRFISDAGLNTYRERTGLDGLRAVVLHMGVQIDDEFGGIVVGRPQADMNKLKLVCVGNLIEVKGHRYLIEAVALLAERGCPVSLDIVGSGRLQATLAQQVDELGMGRRIKFLGQIPQPQLIGLYAAGVYDCLVLPSVDLGAGEHEGIPVSLMEAMAHGVCVVTTRTGGIPELVESGVNGLLVPGQDSGKLVDALDALANDRAVLRVYGDAGRETIAQQFNIKQTVSTLIHMVR